MSAPFYMDSSLLRSSMLQIKVNKMQNMNQIKQFYKKFNIPDDEYECVVGILRNQPDMAAGYYQRLQEIQMIIIEQKQQEQRRQDAIFSICSFQSDIAQQLITLKRITIHQLLLTMRLRFVCGSPLNFQLQFSNFFNNLMVEDLFDDDIWESIEISVGSCALRSLKQKSSTFFLLGDDNEYMSQFWEAVETKTKCKRLKFTYQQFADMYQQEIDSIIQFKKHSQQQAAQGMVTLRIQIEKKPNIMFIAPQKSRVGSRAPRNFNNDDMSTIDDKITLYQEQIGIPMTEAQYAQQRIGTDQNVKEQYEARLATVAKIMQQIKFVQQKLDTTFKNTQKLVDQNDQDSFIKNYIELHDLIVTLSRATARFQSIVGRPVNLAFQTSPIFSKYLLSFWDHFYERACQIIKITPSKSFSTEQLEILCGFNDHAQFWIELCKFAKLKHQDCQDILPYFEEEEDRIKEYRVEYQQYQYVCKVPITSDRIEIFDIRTMKPEASTISSSRKSLRLTRYEDTGTESVIQLERAGYNKIYVQRQTKFSIPTQTLTHPYCQLYGQKVKLIQEQQKFSIPTEYSHKQSYSSFRKQVGSRMYGLTVTQSKEAPVRVNKSAFRAYSRTKQETQDNISMPEDLQMQQDARSFSEKMDFAAYTMMAEKTLLEQQSLQQQLIMSTKQNESGEGFFNTYHTENQPSNQSQKDPSDMSISHLNVSQQTRNASTPSMMGDTVLQQQIKQLIERFRAKFKLPAVKPEHFQAFGADRISSKLVPHRSPIPGAVDFNAYTQLYRSADESLKSMSEKLTAKQPPPGPRNDILRVHSQLRLLRSGFKPDHTEIYIPEEKDESTASEMAPESEELNTDMLETQVTMVRLQKQKTVVLDQSLLAYQHNLTEDELIQKANESMLAARPDTESEIQINRAVSAIQPPGFKRPSVSFKSQREQSQKSSVHEPTLHQPSIPSQQPPSAHEESKHEPKVLSKMESIFDHLVSNDASKAEQKDASSALELSKLLSFANNLAAKAADADDADDADKTISKQSLTQQQQSLQTSVQPVSLVDAHNHSKMESVFQGLASNNASKVDGDVSKALEISKVSLANNQVTKVEEQADKTNSQNFSHISGKMGPSHISGIDSQAAPDVELPSQPQDLPSYHEPTNRSGQTVNIEAFEEVSESEFIRLMGSQAFRDAFREAASSLSMKSISKAQDEQPANSQTHVTINVYEEVSESEYLRQMGTLPSALDASQDKSMSDDAGKRNFPIVQAQKLGYKDQSLISEGTHITLKMYEEVSESEYMRQMANMSGSSPKNPWDSKWLPTEVEYVTHLSPGSQKPSTNVDVSPGSQRPTIYESVSHITGFSNQPSQSKSLATQVEYVSHLTESEAKSLATQVEYVSHLTDSDGVVHTAHRQTVPSSSGMNWGYQVPESSTHSHETLYEYETVSHLDEQISTEPRNSHNVEDERPLVVTREHIVVPMLDVQRETKQSTLRPQSVDKSSSYEVIEIFEAVSESEYYRQGGMATPGRMTSFWGGFEK